MIIRFLSLPVIIFCLFPSYLSAQPYNQGPKTCLECHESEHAVWKETKHFKAYKDVHKRDKADAILEAVGHKSMKKSKVCTACHYTIVQKDASSKGRAKAGPSCESCHGASSDWLELHNDYGGKGVKAENETPDHKKQRIETAKSKGMIWSFMHYDIAKNCNSCHGLARTDIKSDIMAKMLEAGHPANEEFELVKYSQGSVRHRFYPPDITNNAKMTKSELARLYIVGQAATLVSASKALAEGGGEKYKAYQAKRIDDAKKALSKITSVPEAKALIDAATEENAMKLTNAIKEKDLSGEIGGLLPTEFK